MKFRTGGANSRACSCVILSQTFPLQPCLLSLSVLLTLFLFLQLDTRSPYLQVSADMATGTMLSLVVLNMVHKQLDITIQGCLWKIQKNLSLHSESAPKIWLESVFLYFTGASQNFRAGWNSVGCYWFLYGISENVYGHVQWQQSGRGNKLKERVRETCHKNNSGTLSLHFCAGWTLCSV